MRATRDARQPHPAERPRPTLGGAWWIPLAFVVVALIVLLVTPIVVSHRVEQLRHDGVDRTNPARVLVNDFEAAFATENVARYGMTADPRMRDSVVAQARLTERHDEQMLDTLLGHISPEAVERFVVMRAWEQRRGGAPDGTAQQPDASAPAPEPTAGDIQIQVLVAAEHLDDYLFDRSKQFRQRIQLLERINVVSAAVLAPIALLAAAVVFAFGRRMLFVARTADAERAALVEVTERRSTLMHGVTHDIKNPLGAAFGYASLLDDGLAGSLTPEQRDMVQRIRRLLGVAQSTIADLLDLARADSGRLRISADWIDAGALVADVVRDYQASAQQKQLALHFEPPESRIVLRTDAERVREILGNLLSNAIKYTPAPGRVEARMATAAAGPLQSSYVPGARVGITISDTGPGIPPEVRERVFDEFFRLDNTQEVASGAGLGLSISRRIARLLGGDITLDAAPGGGAAFTLWVPREEAPT